MSEKMVNNILNQRVCQFFFTALFLFYSGDMAGMDNANKAVVSGNIKSEYSQLTLTLAYCPYYIIGEGNELKVSEVQVDKNGNFKFSIDDIRRAGRIRVYENQGYSLLFDYDLIEPGDSIFINAKITDGKIERRITGKGSQKFNCRAELEAVNTNIFYDLRDNPNVKEKFDSLKAVIENTLLKYKQNIPDSIYHIMYNHEIGKIAYLYIFSVCQIPDTLSEEKLNILERKFNEFTKDIRGSGYYEYLAPGMILYLFNKERISLTLNRHGGGVSFEDFYNKIKNSYTGSLRQQLITYLFKNKMAMNFIFGGADPYVYKDCLEDALQLVTIPELRLSILNEYNRRSYGAECFNFALPKDSSKQIVRLSDLKGKVILLDLWGYSCTGCYLFSKAFHEKIFPKLKSDTNFRVVSIMLDNTANYNHYLKRLRREGNTTYTYPEYLNLYGGKDVKNARELFNYYNIDIVPTIFIIGKDGRMFSSTIPYFNDKESGNVLLLTTLINKALGK